ncbi:MAG: hypothetical protein EOO61_14985 [Hymenobacter sp.]|nr:MAG: hypothetical protein EOO61_14985 [Hymenobacter sp.]
MVLLLQTEDGFSLFHDPLHNWLHARWVGRKNAEVMRQNYTEILQQVHQLKCLKLLNDSSEDQDGWSELTTWLANNCFPELSQSGIQAVAWVLPKDVQAYRHTQQVLALTKVPLVDVFQDVDAAHEWLQKWPRQR